jgi:hypothetical protein
MPFDNTPGGLGMAESLFERIEELLRAVPLGCPCGTVDDYGEDDSCGGSGSVWWVIMMVTAMVKAAVREKLRRCCFFQDTMKEEMLR